MEMGSVSVRSSNGCQFLFRLNLILSDQLQRRSALMAFGCVIA